MTTRQALDARASSLMLLLCALWGLQQVVLKATASDIAPVMQIALRSGAAALLLSLWMRSRGDRMRINDGTLRPGLLVASLFSAEFLLLGEGLRYTSASHAVVFLYTAPIFVALGLHLKLPSERLGLVQWLGIGLAFAGIVLAFFGSTPQAGAADPMMMLWGDALSLMAGMLWAATTVVVRCSRLASAPVAQTLMYQLVGAFVLLLLASVALGQTHIHFTPWVWGSLIFQAVIISFASLLTWFWLLRHYLASRLGVFSFLTPLFGVGFGVWFLDEPLEPRFVLGAALVLAGVMLVSSAGWLNAARARWARS